MTCRDEATYVARTEPSPYPGDDGLVFFCGFHAATEPSEEVVPISSLPMSCTGCGEPVWAKYAERHAIGECTLHPGCRGTEHALCSCPTEAAYEAAMSDDDPSDDDPRYTDRGVTVAERNGER